MKRNSLMKIFFMFVIAMVYFMSAKAMVSEAMASETGIKVTDQTPVIHSFTSEKKFISLGETTTLEWNVSNAKKIELMGLSKMPEEELPLTGKMEIWPTETTTYILVAKGEKESVSATVTVNVNAVGNVMINSFQVSENSIEKGKSVTLTWDTTNAKKVTMVSNGKTVDLSLQGSQEVLPMETTTYVLMAEGSNGEVVSNTVTVNVVEYNTASITYFKAASDKVLAGDSTILSWGVTSAKSVSISGLKDNLALKGSLAINPEKTTKYVLTAVGKDGVAVTAEVTITVVPKKKAVIKSFTTSKAKIMEGEDVTLTWEVADAEIISIVDIKEGIAAKGTLKVTPAQTTVYTLKAIGTDGTVATSKLVVEVEKKKPAVIKSFTISANEIKEGEKVTITWEVADANKISIQNAGINVASKGAIEVSPKENTTYVLEAVGTDGVTVTKSLTVNVILVKAPKIKSFTATATEIKAGTLVTLNWTSVNADGCIILTSNGLKVTGRPANGSITVTPNKTLTFTLVAYDKDFNTDEQSITINVK